MSADKPATVHDSPARNDRARPAEAERSRPAEQAPSRQQADTGGRPHQPAQTLNRADYNRTRHDAPPIQRSGDGGRQQSDARARVGVDGERRTEQVTSGRAVDTAHSGPARGATLNRAEYNQARHASPPIQRDRSAAAGPQADPSTRQARAQESGRAPEAHRTGTGNAHVARQDDTTTTERANGDRGVKYRHEPDGHEVSSAGSSGLRVADPASGSPDRVSAARAAGDSTRPAEQAPSRQTGVEQLDQPARGLSRDDHNQARHAEPPILRPEVPESLEEQQGRPHSWFSVAEADRTVGDLTPTGIGLKPTGEQLMESESGERSRFEKLRRGLEDEDFINDLHDTGEEQANTLEQVFAARHPLGHAIQSVPDSHYHPLPVQEHASAGDIVGAGFVAGLVLFEAGRRIHGMLAHGKEKVD